MKAEFWHERWERNQIGFHQSEVNSHLQNFWPNLKVEAGATVFVPLCGKSSDMLWLRAQGYQVLGVELSQAAVKDFFAENDLKPVVSQQGAFECWAIEGLVIYVGDFFSLAVEDLAGCSAVFDRASLIALPPEMRADYARRLCDLLPNGCDALLITLEYDQSIANGPPFSVLEPEVKDFYTGSFVVELLSTIDATDDLPGLKKRGVPSINEKTYLLTDKRS